MYCSRAVRNAVDGLQFCSLRVLGGLKNKTAHVWVNVAADVAVSLTQLSETGLVVQTGDAAQP